MTSRESGKRNEYQADFWNAVSEFLLPNHYKGTALLRFIKHRSGKWGVRVEPVDVLADAIKRGAEYIQKSGCAISKPEAWLRVTCTNILRDEVKSNLKQELYANDIVEQMQSFDNPLIETELLEQLEKLQEALRMLSVEDRELIQLRFISGKTYKQVQKFYSAGDEEERGIPLATLRQRESRALKKLREVFFKLYHTEEI
jgi:RNA polymerase sigma factor (sigma-70 family)